MQALDPAWLVTVIRFSHSNKTSGYACLLGGPMLGEASKFARVRVRVCNDAVELPVHALEPWRLLAGLRRHQDLRIEILQ